MVTDFSKNKNQADFLNAALMAASGKSEVRQIIAAGGIRSGKSFCMLATLTILCALYPGSRWVVYRKDFPSLVDTTIVSMEKMLAGTTTWKWSRSPSNYFCEHIATGSRIYFFGENIQQDPNLNAILGLEMNGCALEQIDELSETLYLKIQSRLGSYLLPKMPKPLMLMTTNPCQGFVKDTFYIPHINGNLPEHKMYISMNPDDNHFLTEDQREIFNQLDERTRQQFILGNWADLRSKDDLFAYAFDRKKHVAVDTENPKWNGDRNHHLHLSFDFNINPISALVVQHIDGEIRVLEQIKLANSNIYALCDYIKVKWHGFMLLVTGDASGKNSQAMVKDQLNYYKIIKQQLQLTDGQFNVPSVNPRIEENQVLVNSILERYKIQIHPEKGKPLIFDLENVRMKPDGGILKDNRSDLKQQADCLDTFRYYLNTNFKSFINLKTIYSV